MYKKTSFYGIPNLSIFKFKDNTYGIKFGLSYYVVNNNGTIYVDKDFECTHCPEKYAEFKDGNFSIINKKFPYSDIVDGKWVKIENSRRSCILISVGDAVLSFDENLILESLDFYPEDYDFSEDDPNCSLCDKDYIIVPDKSKLILKEV